MTAFEQPPAPEFTAPAAVPAQDPAKKKRKRRKRKKKVKEVPPPIKSYRRVLVEIEEQLQRELAGEPEEFEVTVIGFTQRIEGIYTQSRDCGKAKITPNFENCWMDFLKAKLE
mmetsp:Transcript_10306/g.11543  ORF Transcript_10306/g.11543 Transcript_10306/m.11543 type:complete len:113 (-) Transcript_10306:29-367(-)